MSKKGAGAEKEKKKMMQRSRDKEEEKESKEHIQVKGRRRRRGLLSLPKAGRVVVYDLVSLDFVVCLAQHTESMLPIHDIVKVLPHKGLRVGRLHPHGIGRWAHPTSLAGCHRQIIMAMQARITQTFTSAKLKNASIYIVLSLSMIQLCDKITFT